MQTLSKPASMQDRPLWGVHLWDQTSNLLKYQQSGIVLHERLQKFLLDISRLQEDSFAIQKKVCDKYMVDVNKVVGIETTYGQAFNLIVQSISKLIDTENLMAVAFELQANGETKTSIQEERQRLKHWKQDRDRFQSEAKSEAILIEEELKKYRAKYKDVVRFKDEYERIDADQTYSKLDVEKALNLYSLKHCEFKQARADYASSLEKFNLYRRRHYTETLKLWGDDGHALEDYRICKTQCLISVLVERLKVTIDRMTGTCLDLEKVLNIMDAGKDAETLIQRLSTGKSPPHDIPFENLVINDPPVVGIDSEKQVCNNAYGPAEGAKTLSEQSRVGTVDNVISAHTRHLMASSTAPLVGAARRLTINSLRFGSANNLNGHSFIRRIFSRRSKSKESERSTPIHSVGLARSMSQIESNTAHRSKADVVSGPCRKEIDFSDSSDTSFCSFGKIRPNTNQNAHSSKHEKVISDVHISSLNQHSPTSSTHPTDSASLRKTSLRRSNGNSSRQPHEESQTVESVKPCPRPTRVSTPACAMQPHPKGRLESPTSHPIHPYEVANHSRSSLEEDSVVVKSQKVVAFPQCRGMGGYAGASCAQISQSNFFSEAKIAYSEPDEKIKCQKNVHQPKRKRNTIMKNISSEPHDIPRKRDFVVVGTGVALYDFRSDDFGSPFLSFQAGDKFKILSPKSRCRDSPETDGWLYVEATGSDVDYGYIPAAYVSKQLIQLNDNLTNSVRKLSSTNNSGTIGHRTFTRKYEDEFFTLGQATEL